MRKFTTMSRGLITALEDDTPAVPVDAVTEGSGMDTPAAAEATATTEVAESGADGEAMDAQKEEAEDTMEALESIRDALVVSAANGGMDRHSAKVVSIAVEHMYARVGISTPAMPAMESFGSSSSRVGATSLAMETITESIKKIWDAIVAAMKRAIAWVSEHFTKIFGLAERTVKRADAVLAKVEAVAAKKIKEKTFDNESMAKELHIAGAAGKSVVLSHAASLVAATKTIFDKQSALSTATGDTMAKALEDYSSAKSKDAFAPLLAAQQGGFPTCDLEVLSTDGIQAPGEGLGYRKSPEMFGGKALLSIGLLESKAGKSAATMTAAVATAYANTKVTMVDFKKQPATVKAAMETLEAPEAKTVASAAKSLAENVVDYKKQLDKAKAVKERIIKAAEKIGSSVDKEETPEGKDAVKMAQSVAKAASNKIDQPYATFSGYTLGKARVLLDYVEQSLKNYEAA
jgi:hypothetical protein